jgi:hypothetical protein
VYFRPQVDRTGSEGRMSHRPCRGSPSSAAEQAPESKCGRHSQSIDRSVPANERRRLRIADQTVVFNA